MTMIHPGFHRSVAAIDADLADQVKRRSAGLDEMLHGCFLVERANGSIDRLLTERALAQAREQQPAAAG